VAENIYGDNPLSSGGHRWMWGHPARVHKELATAGTVGAASLLTHVGPRPGRIVGELHASGGGRSTADNALTALEDDIVALADEGALGSWEDDVGHTGSGLRVDAYRRVGPREYSRQPDGDWDAWQSYIIDITEVTGEPR
jgi:hypothetical protein